MEVEAILDGVVTHAAASGFFESVNTHEPKNSPGNGLRAAVWCQSIVPIPAASGLNRTSGRLLFNLRIYSNMLKEPQDAIDPEVIKALDALFTAYSNDFTLDGQIKSIDLLGMYGIPLTAQAGYQKIGETMYRVVTVQLPLIVNDLWEQAP
jgi:hypothetical protein